MAELSEDYSAKMKLNHINVADELSAVLFFNLNIGYVLGARHFEYIKILCQMKLHFKYFCKSVLKQQFV